MAAKSGENRNFTPFHRTLFYYPAGQKFARNRSISYGFRDTHTFHFLQKSKMAAKSGENRNFTPFHRTLFYYPAGQKFARNRSISYGFRDTHTFHFLQKSKMTVKSGENPNFTPLHRTLLYYPAGQKFARNRSICYGFQDIHTFSFTAKIQDGRQKWRKSKFFTFAQDTLVLPCGSKLRSKSHYLLRFSRYSHFFIFRKNLRWPPRIETLPLCIGQSSTTLWVKNLRKIALSLTVLEILTLFHFPQKSKMTVKSGEN